MPTRENGLQALFSPFVLLCILGGLAIFSTTMAKNPALPLFIRSLGVSQSTLGFIAAASTVVGIVVSLPAGILSDLYGRKRALLFSGFVFASAPFLYLLVHSPWQLVLVRIYHGLATAILGPVALAIVADTFDTRRGENMAWYSSATMVGRFLAPSVGGVLIVGQDFRWVYLDCEVAGVLTLLLALGLPLAPLKTLPLSRPDKATAGTPAPQRGHAEPAAKRGYGGPTPKRGYGVPTLQQSWKHLRQEVSYVVHSRGIFTTSLAQAAQYVAFGFLEVYLPLRLADAGWPAWQIGPLFTVQVLATALTKPVMGRLTDRFGRVVVIVGGLVAAGAALLLLSPAQSYALLAACSGLFGLGLAAVTAAAAALVSDLAHENAYGAAMGVLSSIMDVGQSSGPIVGGLLVGAFGYPVAFAGVASLLVLAAAAFPLAVRRR
jgi:DHA1 family multidrug resistance protein-like MFS transporter